jgi:hypothetical protein
MTRNVIRGSNLNRVTTISDTDLLVLWKGQDPANAMTFDDFKTALGLVAPSLDTTATLNDTDLITVWQDGERKSIEYSVLKALINA